MSAVARFQRSEDSGSTNRADLFDIVRKRSFRRGKFKLSSGRESELYFNLKPTMMNPRGAYLAARAFLEKVWPENVDFVGGLEMGAVPIIGSMAAISETLNEPVKTFFVRKIAKEHGTMDLIEGLGPNETLSGARVLIADDVATSGGSILKAIIAARTAGATVNRALVLVDREEGAAEFLKEQGVKLLSVFRGSEFLR